MRNIMKIMLLLTAATIAMLFAAPSISAAPITSADTGNISWILICSALVFIMTPGVALFYGGMLRKQSMSSILVQTLATMSVMTVSWMLIGYTLAFGTDIHGIIGNLDHIFLKDVDAMSISAGSTIPDMEFMLFQMMFAMITAAIVLGACAERVKFKAIIIFLAIWSVAVYAPMAHWVWGGGLFDQHLVVLDFAGGTVVHICAAATGLAIALALGKRSEHAVHRPHSIPMVFLGCLFLWVGWFGFNGGSGLAADGVAINAIVVTQVSAAFAAVSWSAVQYFHVGRVNVMGTIAGAVAGLVAITPAAGFVGPSEAIAIGLIGGLVCYAGVTFMHKKMKVDDAADVFGIHGIGGIWGAVATGIFALPAMTEAGYEGLLYGGTALFAGQLVAVVATLAFTFIVSLAIIKVIGKFTDIRLTETEEMIGADVIEHGEPSYNM